MEEKKFLSCNFNYINLNEYLKDLPGVRFFYFFEKANMIRYLIDNPEWDNFFENKETM